MKTWITIIFSGLLLSAHANAGIVEEKGCGSCHRLHSDDTGKVFTAPDLHYAGNKFQPKWLKQFLKNPEVIRPAGFTTDSGFSQTENLSPHSSFTEQEANTLTDDLMDLKISTPSPVTSEPLSKGLRAKIKYQFERTFGCISCHQSLNLAGKVRGGISGPSLVNAGNRLQARWVASWLKSPKTYSNKSRMPIYKMEDEARLRLTQFIATLKNENKR